VGWLSTTLIGVSYTLVRLFALAHTHADRLGKVIFVLLNLSIAMLALGFILSWQPIILVGGGILVATAWSFAYDYWRMLRFRHRKLLDVTQHHSSAAVVSFAGVVPGGVATVLFGWGQPRVLVALALFALVGWVGQSTIGYLYKIVPFLIWHERYGPLVGREHVPLMREMISQRWAAVSWWLINIGLLGAVLSAWEGWILPAQVASGLLGTGFVFASGNITGVVLHLRKR